MYINKYKPIYVFNYLILTTRAKL